MRDTTRANAWRLLDTAGGVALGMLLLLLAQRWPATPARAAATVTPNTAVWQAGPYTGCTLVALDQYNVKDESATVTRQVTATWTCPHALPPALLTPAPTPTAR